MSGDVLSNYLGNSWLTQLAGLDLWLGLLTDDPTTSGDPSAELAGGSYIRQPLILGMPSAKAVVSTNKQVFAALDADEINYLGVYDLQVGGHFLLAKQLTTPIEVSELGVFYVMPGDVAIQL